MPSTLVTSVTCLLQKMRPSGPPFTCRACHKSFPRPRDLRRHQCRQMVPLMSLRLDAPHSSPVAAMDRRSTLRQLNNRGSHRRLNNRRNDHRIHRRLANRRSCHRLRACHRHQAYIYRRARPQHPHRNGERPREGLDAATRPNTGIRTERRGTSESRRTAATIDVYGLAAAWKMVTDTTVRYV